MASPAVFLPRLKPKGFRIFYKPIYTTFIHHHIARDASHPLHVIQRRRLARRPKEGLWWHVTTNTNLSRSSCVRAWARRRLRNAMHDALQQHGYDDMGNLVNVAAIQNRPDLLYELKQGNPLGLVGSLRLDVTESLITSSYVDLCADTNRLVKCLVQSLRGEFASQRKIRKNSQPPKFIARPPRTFAGQALPTKDL